MSYQQVFNDNFERVRALLFRRAHAYRAVFKTPGGELGPAAETVMKDLAKYCYADKPTLKVSMVTQQTDPYAMAFAEGRRDVFNRIVALANLTPDQIERIAHHKGNSND